MSSTPDIPPKRHSIAGALLAPAISVTAAVFALIVVLLLWIGPANLPTSSLLVLVTALATLPVLLMARRIRSMLSTPLERIGEDVRRSLAGDALRRLRLPEGTELEELRQLVSDLNQMLARITDLSVDAIDAGRELSETRAALELSAALEKQRRITANANELLAARVGELSLLYEVSKAISATLDMDSLLQRIADEVGDRLKLREFSILLMDEEHRRLVLKAAYGFDAALDGDSVTFELPEGVCGAVARTGKMILVADVSQDERYVQKANGAPANGSLLSLPLVAGGDLIGVINFGRAEPDAFEPTDILHLSAIADQCALALHNAQLYQRAVRLSLHDALTGLGNRRLLDIRLGNELRRSFRFLDPVSVLMIDVDNFKELNDEQGHAAGDEVLRKLARITVATCREVDTVTRYGGEELVVILPRTDAQDAQVVAEKIRANVEKAAMRREPVDGRNVVTVSLGAATYLGGPGGPEAAVLVAQADAAMYQAKQNGRNQVAAYDPEIAEPISLGRGG